MNSFFVQKEDSLVIKGIAIIGMMMLHFWGNPSWILPEMMYRGFFLPNWIFEILGRFGNVCVSLFAFLTGYSIFILADKWKSRRYRLTKIFRFLSYFWIFCIIFWIVGLCIGEEKPDILTGILSLVGIGNEVGVPMCVPFAWYVSFYISIILLAPIIIWSFSKGKISAILMSLVLWLGSKIAFFVFDSEVISNFYLWDFFRRESVIIIPCIGFAFSKYHVFEKVQDFLVGRKCFFVLSVYIAIIILIKVALPNWMEGCLGCLYTLGIVYLIKIVNVSKWRGIGKILSLLGKYSMGIWFISGIFFLPSGRLQSVAYLGGGKSPVLVLVWVLGISFLVSFGIGKLRDLIDRSRNLYIFR